MMDANPGSSHAPATMRAEVRFLAITAIKPNLKNPRTHSKRQIGQIAASIKTFGFNVPLLIDAKHQLIAGHGRLLAAKQLGYTEVPTLSLAHLTDAQARAFMIADNKLSENGGWDDELLVDHFEILQGAELDFAISDTGFELAEIDWRIDKRRRTRTPGTGDNDERVDETPIVRLGDVWKLGNHRVLCGDARSAEDYRRLMGDRLADVVFADPPYNCRIDGHVGGKGEIHHREFAMASGEMSSQQFTDFLGQACGSMAAHSVDGSIHFICMDWRQSSELLAAAKPFYTQQKNLCVWVKDNGGMGSLYRSQHELVYVFKKGHGQHVNNVELGRHGRNRSNVWHFPGINSFGRSSDDGNLLSLHPTVKPTQLVVEALLDCSNRGSLVLDPFLGSGTTLLAAEQSGRICYAIEIDPLYVGVSIQRWQRLSAQKAMLEDSGQNF